MEKPYFALLRWGFAELRGASRFPLRGSQERVLRSSGPEAGAKQDGGGGNRTRDSASKNRHLQTSIALNRGKEGAKAELDLGELVRLLSVLSPDDRTKLAAMLTDDQEPTCNDGM